MDATFSWRITPAGVWVLSRGEPVPGESRWSNDVANAYRLRPGVWCGNPWGFMSRDFDGPTAEADAKEWASAPFLNLPKT